GPGWRGLMIACLIAGVTGAETFMVVASALFTRNLYLHAVPGRSDRHYLWVGRLASAGILALSILAAVTAESVTSLYVTSVKVIALRGRAFWLGVAWRRATAAGVWASFLATVLLWGAMSLESEPFEHIPRAGMVATRLEQWSQAIGLRSLGKPLETLAL